MLHTPRDANSPPPAQAVFANSKKDLDLYGENIEVDYRGYEVTVENFIRVLTGAFSVRLSCKGE